MRQVGILTGRELQCLQLAAEDKDLKCTAENLCLSYNTVRTYRRLILRKMNCQTMAGALMRAIQLGLI